MLRKKLDSWVAQARKEARARLNAAGVNDSVSERQVEMVLEPLYHYVHELGQDSSRLPFRRLAATVLRRGVAELEVLLLPSHAAAFQMLGLSRSTTPRLAKERYRLLARRYHPDKISGDGTRMQEINHAYEVVKRIIGDV